MPKPVNDLAFWRDRLKSAERGELHRSVANWGKPGMGYITATHRVIIRKEIEPDELVLDAGCGYGRMATIFPPEKYMGIDFLPEFVDLAKKRYPAYDFSVDDVFALEGVGPVDVALCVSMKAMIVGNLGEAKWKEAEAELLRRAERIIILEYSHPEHYEVITKMGTEQRHL